MVTCSRAAAHNNVQRMQTLPLVGKGAQLRTIAILGVLFSAEILFLEKRRAYKVPRIGVARISDRMPVHVWHCLLLALEHLTSAFQ